jgi:Kef-type K+ transport system membrane component KefB
MEGFAMEQILFTASLWLAIAVLSALVASALDLSIALVEICAGAAFAALANWLGLGDLLDTQAEWVRVLASAGALVLTFLAGAELDPAMLRAKLTEVSTVGVVGFLAPFLGCTALAFYGLGWSAQASWLGGVALSTTSLAVVYAVMLETGLNKTEYGKGILGACFVNDLATVLALGLLFAPFTVKTVVFIAAGTASLIWLPRLTDWLTQRYAHRTAAIRTKWVLLVLFSLGALALWSGSEAVLPAYLTGMTLASHAAQDAHWIRRIRTLTIGLLTPFYFIRAGSLVSVQAVLAAPLVLLALLAGKVATKIFGLYPVIGWFRRDRKERWYYTLLMSTGLTFGTIAALYGLSHGLVTQDQYSILVAAVIASAVVPTAIAGFFCVPVHLLPGTARVRHPVRSLDSFSDEG